MLRPIRLPILLLLVCLAAPALAEPPRADGLPHGPGHVFESIEAAAVDGLAFAYRSGLESRTVRLSRGGAIRAVEGGFTYDRVVAASPSEPDRLRVPIGESVVAHFHTYPSQGLRLDRQNESHSPGDRHLVDVLDPEHRPSFVLTPSLRVMVYRGRHAGAPRDVFVQRLEAARSPVLARR